MMPEQRSLIEQIENTPIIPNSLAVWGLGQMGLAVKGPDAVLIIDPYLSDLVGERFGDWGTRLFPPPVQPEQVTNADYFLISHEHLDHFDPATLGPAAAASPEARFVTTGWCADLLADLDIPQGRVILPTALEPVTLPGTSARVTVLPSAHYEKEYDKEKGYRWIGFLIEWNGVTFYHAGDTIIYPGYIEMLKALPKADLAMIPANGRDHFRETDGDLTGNMLPIEAARLTQEIGWDVVIPGHNDLFVKNVIPRAELTSAFERVDPRQKVKFLQPGELYYYVKA